MNLFIYKYHTFVSCSFELSETSPAVSERHSSTKQLDTMKTTVTKIVPFPFILEKQEAYKPVPMSIYFKYVKELSKKSIIQRIVRTNILYYSFIEITFDTGLYVKPWRHNSTTVHFRVIFLKLWSRSHWRPLERRLHLFTLPVPSIQTKAHHLLLLVDRDGSSVSFWYIDW